METKKRHHYVPEVYLQNFAFYENGNLFTLKIKIKFLNILTLFY
jgi:hypothetical protein